VPGQCEIKGSRGGVKRYVPVSRVMTGAAVPETLKEKGRINEGSKAVLWGPKLVLAHQSHPKKMRRGEKRLSITSGGGKQKGKRKDIIPILICVVQFQATYP